MGFVFVVVGGRWLEIITLVLSLVLLLISTSTASRFLWRAPELITSSLITSFYVGAGECLPVGVVVACAMVDPTLFCAFRDLCARRVFV